MQQVAHTLEVVRSSVPADCQTVHSQLVDRRTRLNAHVERMHCLRDPAKKSVYEIQGLLLRLKQTVNSSVRWRRAELERLTPEVCTEIADLLIEAGGMAALFLRTDPSPWTGATLVDGSAAQKVVDLVQAVHQETLPRFLASLHEVTTSTGLVRPESILKAKELTDLLDSVEQTLSLYSAEIYGQDLESLLRDLAPGRTGGFAALWAFCTNGTYRRARATVLGLRNNKAAPSQLFGEVLAVASQRKKWGVASGGKGVPVHADNASEHIKNLRRLAQEIGTLDEVLPSKRFHQQSIDDLVHSLASLHADQRTPFQIPKLTQIETSLERQGLGRLVTEIRSQKPDPKLWPNAFQFAWLSSALEAVCQQDPEVRGFCRSHAQSLRRRLHPLGRRANCTGGRPSSTGTWRARYRCHECQPFGRAVDSSRSREDEASSRVTQSLCSGCGCPHGCLPVLDGKPALGEPVTG